MAENELPSSLQISLDGTKVSYVQLGKSGLRVSVPILGGMSFGRLNNGRGSSSTLSNFLSLL